MYAWGSRATALVVTPRSPGAHQTQYTPPCLAGALEGNSRLMKKLRDFQLLGGGEPLRRPHDSTADVAAIQAHLASLEFLVGYWVSDRLPWGASRLSCLQQV